MKNGKVFFHPIEGSASLTISWTSRPKGDAVEAKKGDGVGFFSEKGDLLCAIFDEVLSPQDHQTLEFSHHRIEITVKNGLVTYSLTGDETIPPKRKKQVRKKKKTSPSKMRRR